MAQVSYAQCVRRKRHMMLSLSFMVQLVELWRALERWRWQHIHWAPESRRQTRVSLLTSVLIRPSLKRIIRIFHISSWLAAAVISWFSERFLIEKSSLELELLFISICSYRILSRNDFVSLETKWNQKNLPILILDNSRICNHCRIFAQDCNMWWANRLLDTFIWTLFLVEL